MCCKWRENSFSPSQWRENLMTWEILGENLMTQEILGLYMHTLWPCLLSLCPTARQVRTQACKDLDMWGPGWTKTGCVKTQGPGSICGWTPDFCGPYEKNSNQGCSAIKGPAPGQEAASGLHHKLPNSTGNQVYGLSWGPAFWGLWL